MLKKIFIGIILIGAVLLVQHAVYAQEGDLQGLYNVQTSGQAVLASPTTGVCSVSGVVPAALFDGIFFFDGHGGMTGTGTGVGISIGATTCTSPNYSVSGTYTVTDNGDGTFQATGTFTTNFQGRPAACGRTALKSQPFSLTGNIADQSFTITTEGAGGGSTYAEAPPPGPLTCLAPITNFITSGHGKKFGF